MKRTILFKGKRVDNGEWVEGKSLIQGVIEGREFAQIEHSDFDNYRQYEVEPDTVCQFTGLLDKNGNKIFEGDIIRPKSYHPTSEVFFMNGSFKVNGKMGKIGFGSWSKSVEIIGNIHD